MIDPTWHVDEPDPEEAATPGSPLPTLVSLHFLRAALRRRWRLWVGIALVGMLLGVALNAAIPAKSEATFTLYLAHDPQQDPTRAMATDVSLLGTRRVASSVIQQLGLKMTPEAFLESFTAQAVTDQVLLVHISGPTDAAAVTRAQTLANAYLTFRSTELQRQSTALVDGYQTQVTSLESQVSRLTTTINSLPTTANPQDLITQRGDINNQIQTLQQTIQDATLRTTSVVTTSHVLDPSAAVPRSVKKRAVLDTASGLIGGTAVGIGLVLFLALTSGRLRRREEVATALAAPVRVSVGRLRPRAWRRIHPFRRTPPPPRRDLQVLVHGLDSALRPLGGRRARLGLASVDSVEDAELAVAALTATLRRRGLAVFLVDLSESGRLSRAVNRAISHSAARHAGPTTEQVVFRPDGVPSLARGPLGAPLGQVSDLQEDDPRRAAWDDADVVLTLAEVDPAIGAEHLASWADQVIVLATAGRSSAERLRTTAELIRSAGLQLLFGVLLRADRGDESLGQPDDGPSRRTNTR